MHGPHSLVLLVLCMAHTVWSEEVITTQMVNQVANLVWFRNLDGGYRVIRGLPIDVTNVTSYDDVVLAKATGVILDLLIDGDQWQAEKKMKKKKKKKKKLNWQITNIFLKSR